MAIDLSKLHEEIQKAKLQTGDNQSNFCLNNKDISDCSKSSGRINRFWIHALIAIYPNGEMKFEKQWMQADAGHNVKKKVPKKKVIDTSKKISEEYEEM